MITDSLKFIHVGQIHIDVAPVSITTVLGSCIAVCLYDKKLCIGGMNHYLLPFWNDNGLQSSRFGNIAIPKLIENMLDKGAKINTLEAKIFGGASINISCCNAAMMVGEKNILVAREILKEYKIDIVSEDVGGKNGRKIQFNLAQGKVLLKYTAK
ncbi:MAG: chemotaxis protein CheD [Sulfurimonas sp. RIFCSPHIGHO2_12_FULL_36_9]|uniref:chemotaxis protein CheD n=1 Tax=Sulfurimonas sp. RIFCSPLOWO2_12_36_12 TaxID=1802253 RepID=UPI0008CCB786|nr:chemotaxis protein CheD [Sulfurimonas sp. RIFCSPLOWO2_12_36_12]OHD97754.1 MAG: chemotaxis protein CheD [Sulfurimonas sp. RIFCSPLOWO2_02_FULL_36_28]OHD98224.1 MAG: chemotaxis protein CheD [Sulfurimonas sp. RIFCSPHIGHO2_12_FULL_36_9]OHE00739.1 MAG: chemotaxis protein CheD [Sulfurimonas sp. RIFCSPLOWO2_12_36_12]OHE08255.1 MAG: chemotaxis protein CheD [Sulfurimonas sp. RIFCSPLOWO2_12_FULL_36_74]